MSNMKLQLTGFGPYGRETIVEFAPVTLLMGDSGAGKTAILDALSIALRGHSPRFTNAAGRMIRNVVHPGAREARVALTIGDTTTERIVNDKGIRIRRGDMFISVGSEHGKAVMATLHKATVSPVLWDVLLDAASFAQMDDTARAKFLAQVAGGKVSEQELTDAIAALGELAFKTWGELPDPYNWDYAHKTLYAWRTDANARVKRLAALSGDDEVVAVDEELVRREETALRELRDKYEAVVSARREAALRESARARLTAELAEITETPDPAGELAEAKAAAKAATAPTPLPPDPSGELRLYQSILGKLSGDKLVCPVNHTPCSVITKTAVQERIAELEPQVAEFEEAKREHDRLAEAATAAHRRVEAAERAIKEYAALTGKRLRLEAELKRLGDNTTTDHDPDTLKAEIEEKEQALAEQQRRLGAAQERDKARGELNGATAMAEALDKLVKAYAPNGLRRSLTKDTGFAEHVSEAARRFFGGEFGVDFDAGTVTTDRGVLPFASLSHGEALRLGIAVQLGVGLATGFWFVAVDEFGGALGWSDRAKIMQTLVGAHRQNGRLTAILLGQLPSALSQTRHNGVDVPLTNPYKSPEIEVYEVRWTPDGSTVRKAERA